MPTYEQSTGKTIDEAFADFHAQNPHIYTRFVELALKMIAAGHARYSSKTILCVIRFERDMATVSDDDFKINDALTSRYARQFIADYPQHKDFFELRELRTSRRKRTFTQGELFA